MNWVRYLIIIGLFFSTYTTSWCQQKDSTLGVDLRKDTVVRVKEGNQNGATDSPYKVDSITRKKHDPRKATLYSAVCPGLGQFYNHKYWKLPLVAAAIGIPVYTYFYNKHWFQKCQYAIAVMSDTPVTPQKLATVDPKLQIFVTNYDINDLLNYRNSFRQDEDYSVLFFLLFWGLNVVDATVDAHLRDFDISNNLSMRVEPSPTPSASGFVMSNTTGLSLVFDIHKTRYKPIPLP